MSSLNLGPEPVAIIGTVDAVLIGVQTQLPVSTLAHTIVAVVLIVLGTVLARAGVTPNAKVKA